MSVAETVLQQLGGYRFAAMTGAKNFAKGENELFFLVPRTRDGITRVAIALNARDTYDVRFYKMVKYEPVLVKETLGVYADQLREVFTAATGFDTSL